MRDRLHSPYRIVTYNPVLDIETITTIPHGRIEDLKIMDPFRIITLKKSSNNTFFREKDVESVSGKFFPNAELIVNHETQEAKVIVQISGEQFNFEFDMNRDQILEWDKQGKSQRVFFEHELRNSA